MTTRTLEPEVLHKMDADWRAANYLSVGQIYLYDNPLLKRPLRLSDVKPLVVGHWERRRVKTSSMCRSFTPAGGMRTNIVTADSNRDCSGGNALLAGATSRCVLGLT